MGNIIINPFIQFSSDPWTEFIGSVMGTTSSVWDAGSGVLTHYDQGGSVNWDDDSASDEAHGNFIQLTGDFDVTVQIPGISDAWNIRDSIASIQIREDLSSANPIVYQNDLWYDEVGDNWNYTVQRYRLTNGGTLVEGFSSATGHNYIRVTRVSNDFKSYTSNDGSSWGQRLSTISIPNMPSTCYVGLWSNPRDNGNTNDFDIVFNTLTGFGI